MQNIQTHASKHCIEKRWIPMRARFQSRNVKYLQGDYIQKCISVIPYQLKPKK